VGRVQDQGLRRASRQAGADGRTDILQLDLRRRQARHLIKRPRERLACRRGAAHTCAGAAATVRCLTQAAAHWRPRPEAALARAGTATAGAIAATRASSIASALAHD
jgi:hypothetical protein